MLGRIYFEGKDEPAEGAGALRDRTAASGQVMKIQHRSRSAEALDNRANRRFQRGGSQADSPPQKRNKSNVIGGLLRR